MFTGLIQAVGAITHVEALGQIDHGVRLSVNAGDLLMDDVAIGDSIAINGACMTVVFKDVQNFMVDVSQASLMHTAGLGTVGSVNLEKSMTLTTKLGGHLVTGHVDGVGVVSSFLKMGESHELIIAAPRQLAKYIAHKGSIVVNGVALTVNSVEDQADACLFSMNIIPHTLEMTTLKGLVVGAKVNIEVDLIARYVERMLLGLRNS